VSGIGRPAACSERKGWCRSTGLSQRAFVGSKPTGRTILIKEECMTKPKETLEKAYGSIPREPTVRFDQFDWLPTPRGVKYYWLKLLRFLTR